jgi:hypothetical protein
MRCRRATRRPGCAAVVAAGQGPEDRAGSDRRRWCLPGGHQGEGSTKAVVAAIRRIPHDLGPAALPIIDPQAAAAAQRRREVAAVVREAEMVDHIRQVANAMPQRPSLRVVEIDRLAWRCLAPGGPPAHGDQCAFGVQGDCECQAQLSPPCGQTDGADVACIIHEVGRSARTADGRPWSGDAAARDLRRLGRRPEGADRGAGRLRFRGLIRASAPFFNRRGAAGVRARGAGWPCRVRRSAGAA